MKIYVTNFQMRSFYLITLPAIAADLAADIMKEWKQQEREIQKQFKIDTHPRLEIEDDDRLARLSQKLRNAEPIILPPITV